MKNALLSVLDLGGCSLICYGVWRISHSAGYIVLGLVLILMAFAAQHRSKA